MRGWKDGGMKREVDGGMGGWGMRGWREGVMEGWEEGK